MGKRSAVPNHRILLIGQAPARKTEGLRAFSGRSGRFLARLVGVTEKEFFEWIAPANLLDYWPGKAGKGDEFPAEEAKARAKELKLEGLILLAGRNVGKAFGVFGSYFVKTRKGGATFVVVPHPSGINLWWNSEPNRKRARRFFRGLLRRIKKRLAEPSSRRR